MIPVTIGIPTLNGPERLARLLHSVKEHTPWDKYAVTLTVIDDKSSEDNFHRNAEIVQNQYACSLPTDVVHFIYQTERSGISRCWNRLVREGGPGDVHVLLNDDVEVVRDWLDVLVFSVTANRHAGMIALNSYCALTHAQHLRALRGGAELETQFTVKHAILPRLDYVESKLMGDEHLLASSGSAFAFSHEVWEEAGGFDERYFCYYEELDFGTTLRAKGYRHYIASYPVIYHMGGATNSDSRNLDANSRLAESRKLYREKWGGTPSVMRESLAVERWRGNLSGEIITREWNSSLRNVND